MSTYVLRIDCSDQKGLVHNITGVLFKYGFNITSNGEFVDKERGHFFMRTEFVGEPVKDELIGELRALLPENASVELIEARKKDIVILASTEPHCLGDLLIRHAYDEINARIRAVVSNHERLKALVEGFQIPFHYAPHEGLSREEHERTIREIINRNRPDYIILARYMRIFTPEFISAYHNRIINIHHSFLPAFIGASPYRQAYERGVKIIGATAHFVTNDLDEGPIITQNVTQVDHTYGPHEMQQAGRDVEKVVLAKALKLVFEDRVFINKNKTIIFE
jgi:formyltetrahydrofolate deformylase